MQTPSGPALTPWQLCMGLSERVQLQQRQLYETQCKLQEQQQLMTELQRQIDELRVRLIAAESRPVYHIEKMEYAFDQLKVEKLDGTLNIGMTPPNEEYIKEIGQLVMPGGIAAPGKTPAPSADPATSGPNQFPSMGATSGPGATAPQPPYPEIRQQVDIYLNQTAPQRLAQLESEYGIPLDPYHRRLIIEDIRKQMSTRVQYYIQQTARAAGGESGEDHPPSSGNAEQSQFSQQQAALVLAKTTRDIDAALRAYMDQLRGGANQGGDPL
ncbi:spore germination protein GerPC [Paenibacillus xanthanilyticus]|uniref:Spore germination protein GerPC n=1 Tax=Paenibacillus xanthanilyticus TaxID=1783531 RepID=A0ABV8K4P2_9BACL